MDFATLTTTLKVENHGLDLDIQSIPEAGLRDFLAEYFSTGRLVVRNITQEDRNPQSETITIKGMGGARPFAEIPVTVVFNLRYDEKARAKVAAVLIEGTCDKAWEWRKSFPSLQDTWLSTMKAIPLNDKPAARLVLRSYDEGETTKKGLRFEGQFTSDFLNGLQSFLPGQEQHVAGSIEMIPADRSLNKYRLTRLPAASLTGPLLDLRRLDKSAFPLSFSRLTYSLYCRPHLDLAQLCWTYKAFLIIEGAIQFVARGKTYQIPLSATVHDTSGAVLITASPAEGIKGLLEEIGVLVGMSLSAPNGIVGAADLLRLREINVLVDPEAAVKIGYITCHVKTGENIRWQLIPGLLTLDAIDLHFRIDRPFGPDPHIGIIVSGLLGMSEHAALELSAYFDHDSSGNNVAFGGTLKRGPLRAREVFKRFLGYDNPHLPDVQVDNFNFLVKPGAKTYSAEIALSDQWKLEGPSGFPVHLSYLHFRFRSEGEAGAEVEMRASFDVCGCALYVGAAYEGVAKGWTFRGGASEGNPIPVGIGIDKFVRAIGSFGPIPTVLREITIRDLEVVFNTVTSDFSFRATTSFPIDGNSKTDGKASLTVHLDFTKEPGANQSKHALKFGGALYLSNREFAVGYGSHDNTSLLVAAYDSHGGDTIEIKDFVGQISKKIADVIPPGLTISLKHAQLAFGKTGDASKFLFGIELGAGIQLSQLPLVGSVFDRSQTLSMVFQLLAASADFEAGEVQEINQLTASGVTKLPDGKIDTSQRKVQIKAVAQLGGISQQLDLPMETDVERSVSATSVKIVSTATADKGLVKWFNIQKAFGPFHFQRLGIGLMGQNIDFLLDASLQTAGLTITLEGLAAECALAELSKGNFHPAFHLNGLGVDFKRGDLEIGGALLRSGEDQYDGALTLHYKTLGIQALGSYRTLDGHPSLFVYALINYPIGGPAFFFVEGLALGFGYNRTLTIPTLDQVSEFPLVKQAIAPPGEPSDPMQMVAELRQYITPAVGEYFLTAGVRFSSFKNIEGFVLLTVLFGQHFEIDVLGKATLSSPPKLAGAGPPPLISASLALLARFLPEEGVLMVMAKLLPDAHVFSPDCHITGGFAFYCWFDKEHKGDFVLTLGGYHKSFDVPAHYPRVPRLGLNWQVNQNLTIKADAYFALTPSALMAGGHLEATWQSGNLRAWFNAAVDFLIAWKPYHYEGEASVSIGASYSFQFFGWHTVSVELAADLKIWGPPFSGVAHVHWFIISFDVAFGDQRKQPLKALKWDEFQESFLPKTNDICTVAARAGKVAQHGSQAKEKTNANQRAHLGVINPRQLSIVVNSAIPITKPLGALLTRPAHPSENLMEPKIGIAPMNKKHGEWESSNEITIHHNGKDVSDLFLALPMRQSVPAALWAEDMNPKPGNRQLIENAICDYEIHPAKPISHTRPKAANITNENPHSLTLTSQLGGAPTEFAPALDQGDVRAKIKDKLLQPGTRSQRQAFLKGLLTETEIDWSGVTVESWRGTPMIVTEGMELALD